MADILYKPLIKDMVWSFSRIQMFEDCPYRWYLRYLKGHHEDDSFYSSFGSFMHKLIELYYNKIIDKKDMVTIFLRDFSKEVKGKRPKESVVMKYINNGCDYLRNFEPFKYNKIEVEKKVEFDIDGIPFVGYIDFLGEKDGEFYIVDNKSRDLKPRSHREKPTLKDKELDEMLRQLYIYSEAVKKEYGKYPKALCFNCFRTGVFIEEPFDMNALNETKNWVKNRIADIENEEDFTAYGDFFKCSYLCGVNEYCERRRDT